MFFTEASHVINARDLGAVSATIKDQNGSLTSVKIELARRVRAKGGDGLVGFTYGQKNTYWSGVHWHGSGSAVKLPRQV